MPALRSSNGTTQRERIEAYAAEHPQATVKQASKKLGIAPQNIYTLNNARKKQGLPPLFTSAKGTTWTASEPPTPQPQENGEVLLQDQVPNQDFREILETEKTRLQRKVERIDALLEVYP